MRLFIFIDEGPPRRTSFARSKGPFGDLKDETGFKKSSFLKKMQVLNSKLDLNNCKSIYYVQVELHPFSSFCILKYALFAFLGSCGLAGVVRKYQPRKVR